MTSHKRQTHAPQAACSARLEVLRDAAWQQTHQVRRMRIQSIVWPSVRMRRAGDMSAPGLSSGSLQAASALLCPRASCPTRSSSEHRADSAKHPAAVSSSLSHPLGHTCDTHPAAALSALNHPLGHVCDTTCSRPSSCLKRCRTRARLSIVSLPCCKRKKACCDPMRATACALQELMTVQPCR